MRWIVVEMLTSVMLIAGVSVAFGLTPQKPAKPPEKVKAPFLAGQLVDLKGNPIPGSVMISPGSEFGKHTEFLKTDDQGKFQTKKLTSDVPILILSAESDEGLMFAGAFINREELGLVRLTDWNYFTQNLTIPLHPPLEVNIKVIDAAGSPVPDAVIGAKTNEGWARRSKTNQQGEGTVALKGAKRFDFVFAYKDGVGMDYKAYVKLGEYKSVVQSYPNPEGVITLQLEGATSLEVSVTGHQDKPDSGAWVSLEGLVKESEPAGIDIRDLLPGGLPRTDEQGKVRLDWLPKWQKRMFIVQAGRDLKFFGNRKYFPQGYEGDDPEALISDVGSGKLVVKFIPEPVPVRGKVVDTQGRPIPSAILVAGSGGNLPPQERKIAISGWDGSFEFRLQPGFAYIISCIGITSFWSKEVTDTTEIFTVREGEPLEGLVLTQQPHATRLHVKVTDSSGTPARPLRIYCLQFDNDLEKLTSLQMPNPHNVPSPWFPELIRATEVSQDGQFELFVGPGTYILAITTQEGEVLKKTPMFTITDEKEITKEVKLD